MRKFVGYKAALLGGSSCLLFVASPLHAQTANGLVVEPRVYNDFNLSTETVRIGTTTVPTPVPTPVGNLPALGLPNSVEIHDGAFASTSGTGFANRDDVLISTDGGATAWTGNINDGFTISANVTLSDDSNTPRKETGIRVNAPVTGDALFILDSDAGEIVAFGGGAPFYSFRPNIEASYTPGQTIFMKEQYVPNPAGTTGATPGTMEYWAQLLPGGPVYDSGPLAFSNLEGGPGGADPTADTYQVGLYDQVQPNVNDASDYIDASFNNIQASVVVPEPASIGMLALGGLTLLSRRRKVARA